MIVGPNALHLASVSAYWPDFADLVTCNQLEYTRRAGSPVILSRRS
jgi:hypothetical protein